MSHESPSAGISGFEDPLVDDGTHEGGGRVITRWDMAATIRSVWEEESQTKAAALQRGEASEIPTRELPRGPLRAPPQGRDDDQAATDLMLAFLNDPVIEEYLG